MRSGGGARRLDDRFVGDRFERHATMAYCPQRRNSGHLTQSVKIFSGSQRCGTIEKPIWLK